MKFILYPNHPGLIDAITRANADYAELIAAFDTPTTCNAHGTFYTVKSAHKSVYYHVEYKTGSNGTLIATCDCPARICCTHVGITFNTALIARKSNRRTVIVDTRPVAMPLTAQERARYTKIAMDANADLFGSHDELDMHGLDYLESRQAIAVNGPVCGAEVGTCSH